MSWYIEAGSGRFNSPEYKIELLATGEDMYEADIKFNKFCNDSKYDHCTLELTSDGSIHTVIPVIAYRKGVK